MTTIVNGLEEEFDGALACDVVDATTEKSKTEIAGYGFDNHGLVVFDTDDTAKWKKNGHHISEAEIRTALAEVMEDS